MKATWMKAPGLKAAGIKATPKAHWACEMTRQPGPWCRGSVLGGILSLAALEAGAAEGPAAPPATAAVEVLGQVTLSLILVVVLLLALAWALRRFARLQPQGGGGLRLLGGLSLGARERILLVQADDRRILVGVAPGVLRTLLVLDAGGGAPGQAAPPVPVEAQGAVRPFGRVG